jgi:hypothetical protein
VSDQTALRTRVMVDLETLGKRPGAIIFAIGAVKFGDGQILDTFYQRIDPYSCERLGLKMDVDTVLWWLKQSDAARAEVLLPGRPLPEVLSEFSTWVGDREAEMWGNGATFDNSLLVAAYECIPLPVPWKFVNDRCFRTARSLHPERPFVRAGTKHNALDDARSQALHLMEIEAAAANRGQEPGVATP